MEEVGVRELRQNASKILERVQSGETFTVTNGGRAVARLSPEPDSEWDGLISSGAVRAPADATALSQLTPRKSKQSASQILEELRSDER